MKRMRRPAVLLLTIGLLAAGAWVVFASSFVHGVIVGILIGLALVVGGFAIFARRLKKRMESHLAPPPLPTGSWDFSMELEDLAGNSVAATQFKGGVLILNFWATWCAPCVAEMPSLIRLHAATADLGVNMVCVTEEQADVVSRFIEKRGVSAPIYRLAQAPPDQFKSRSIPATFILDKKGMIALRHIGAANWDDESVVNFVRGLAATPHA